MLIAQSIVNLALIYLAIGVLFAIIFVTALAGRLDPAAKGAPIGFRLLIFPGVAALWPLLLIRWLRGVDHPPVERTAHRRLAGEGKP